MSEIPTTNSVFSIPAKELAKLIDSLLPLTSSDHTPDLHGVHLSRNGDRVVLAATDRFRAAMTSAAVEWEEGVDDEWSITIPVPLCKQIVTAWKSARVGSWWSITLSASEAADGDTVEALLRDTLGVTVGGKVIVAPHFPSIRKILADTETVDGDPADMVNGFNFDYLLSFAKLRRHSGERVAITWPQTPSRPVRLDIGRHTVGLIMPIRVDKSYTVEEILGGAA